MLTGFLDVTFKMIGDQCWLILHLLNLESDFLFDGNWLLNLGLVGEIVDSLLGISSSVLLGNHEHLFVEILVFAYIHSSIGNLVEVGITGGFDWSILTPGLWGQGIVLDGLILGRRLGNFLGRISSLGSGHFDAQ